MKDEKELVMGRLGGGGQNVPEERTSRTQVVRRGEMVGQSGSCGSGVEFRFSSTCDGSSWGW